ncbi:uncharacterized mitochondrial protein-like protein [Tanacetum coccineum]
MANLSRNGSDALTEVHNQDNLNCDLFNQSEQIMTSSEQSNDVSQSETDIISDSNIIPYSQYLSETQQETVQNSNSSAQQDTSVPALDPSHSSITVIVEVPKELPTSKDLRLCKNLKKQDNSDSIWCITVMIAWKSLITCVFLMLVDGCPNRPLLIIGDSLNSEEPTSCKDNGFGSYQFGRGECYYLKGLLREGLGPHNLFSVGQSVIQIVKWLFVNTRAYSQYRMLLNLLRDLDGDNLYTLSIGNMMASYPICLLSKASKPSHWLWHRSSFLFELWFSITHLAKDMDLSTSYPFSEALVFIINFLKMIQVQLKETVRRIRTDNGTKFVNQTLREYYETVGISHETSVARSPQQNGVLTAMASEHSSSGPALHEMTPVSISSGLVPNPPSSTPFVPPTRSDWDLLFQPMFDESPNVDVHAPEVIAPIPEAVAPEQLVLGTSPVPPPDKAFVISLSGSLDFSKSQEGFFINQSKYALESLKKYGYESCDPVDTPMVEKSKLDEDKGGTAVDPSHYRGMIGTLLYLTASRPDLQFAICCCPRLVSWSSKRQKSAAISSTEAEYIAVSGLLTIAHGTLNSGSDLALDDALVDPVTTQEWKCNLSLGSDISSKEATPSRCWASVMFTIVGPIQDDKK